MPSDTRICNRCKKEKDTNEFYSTFVAKIKGLVTCRECRKHKKHRIKNIITSHREGFVWDYESVLI